MSLTVISPMQIFAVAVRFWPFPKPSLGFVMISRDNGGIPIEELQALYELGLLSSILCDDL
ncbi:hypothetical protein AB9K21_04770 [Anaplasma phagocytophilum]